MTYHVVHDPQGDLAATLPPDRQVHEEAVRTVLAWSSPLDVPAADVVRFGHLLSGAARVIAEDVRAHADRLPRDDARRVFAELILREARDRLCQPCTSLHRVQNRARLVRALYGRLDRLQAAVATAVISP